MEVPKIDVDKVLEQHPNAKPIQAPVGGQIVWQYDVVDSSSAPKIGETVKEGDTVARIQAYYGLEEVKSLAGGKYIAVYPKQGDKVKKDEIIAFVE